MAITYNIKIKEIGDDSYCVSATIIDDTKPIENQEEVVTISSARLETTKEKEDVWENIKAHYLMKLEKLSNIIELENEAKTYLETKVETSLEKI